MTEVPKIDIEINDDFGLAIGIINGVILSLAMWGAIFLVWRAFT